MIEDELADDVTSKGYMVSHLLRDGVPQVLLVDTARQTAMTLTLADLKKLVEQSEDIWKA